ncbi:MAG TPA: hypothetical protein VFP37_01805 [Steroidobacteraceae bacterium]|nr:hypothetical protein [Steroidobacteraceae bacterium]
MNAPDRPTQASVRVSRGVLRVRVPDSAPPLLEICRCACCGGLRRVESAADYISTDGSTRALRIAKG